MEWDCKGKLPEGVAIIALGGNLGDVGGAFRKALDSLQAKGFETLKVSSFLTTKPEGCEEGAPDFLNAVAVGFWPGTALELLALCKQLELEAGRPAEHPHWHSRTLYLDIIAFGPQSHSSQERPLRSPQASW